MAATVPMTVRVPEALHAKLSVEATRQGLTMNDLVRRLLEEGCQPTEPSGPDSSGFCAIRGAGLLWMGFSPNIRSWHRFLLCQLDGDARLEVAIPMDGPTGRDFALRIVRKPLIEAHVNESWYLATTEVEILLERLKIRTSEKIEEGLHHESAR